LEVEPYFGGLGRDTGHMDGNSTMSLAQFLSSHSEIFLSFTLVILTGVLAYYTKNLYHATSKYVDLVGSQNQIMDEQNKMMDENRKHELLVKKYNRMLDEMNKLVAPFYARRTDSIIFRPVLYDDINKIPIKSSEESELFYDSDREFYEFWENIYRNLYLNQSVKLQKCLDEFQKSKRIYCKECNQKLNGCETQGLGEATHAYQSSKENLIDIIEYRYFELRELILEIENKLKIREASQRASDPSH